MNYSIIRYIIGWILRFEACFLCLPAVVGFLYHEKECLAYLCTAAICVIISFAMTKHKPVNKQLYNHPLSLHLYNLNKSKQNISMLGKAIVYESEKSCLKYQSYFGSYNDITDACCGSNISDKQIELLINAGAK